MEVENKVTRILSLLGAFKCEKKNIIPKLYFAKIFKNIRAHKSTGIDFSPVFDLMSIHVVLLIKCNNSLSVWVIPSPFYEAQLGVEIFLELYGSTVVF